MKRDRNIWKVEQKPKVEWRYLQKVGKEVRHCLYDEITLSQINNTDAVWSVAEKLSEGRSKRFVIAHATRYVWDHTEDVTKIPCEFEMKYEGNGVISNQTGKFARIRDDETQVALFKEQESVNICAIVRVHKVLMSLLSAFDIKCHL